VGSSSSSSSFFANRGRATGLSRRPDVSPYWFLSFCRKAGCLFSAWR
jgi:hypothetical protein